MNVHDRPLAAEGLTSYRAKGRFGWIMIGANSPEEAISEAQRSDPTVTLTELQIWDDEAGQYIPCVPS